MPANGKIEYPCHTCGEQHCSCDRSYNRQVQLNMVPAFTCNYCPQEAFVCLNDYNNHRELRHTFIPRIESPMCEQGLEQTANKILDKALQKAKTREDHIRARLKAHMTLGKHLNVDFLWIHENRMDWRIYNDC